MGESSDESSQELVGVGSSELPTGDVHLIPDRTGSLSDLLEIVRFVKSVITDFPLVRFQKVQPHFHQYAWRVEDFGEHLWSSQVKLEFTENVVGLPPLGKFVGDEGGLVNIYVRHFANVCLLVFLRGGRESVIVFEWPKEKGAFPIEALIVACCTREFADTGAVDPLWKDLCPRRAFGVAQNVGLGVYKVVNRNGSVCFFARKNPDDVWEVIREGTIVRVCSHLNVRTAIDCAGFGHYNLNEFTFRGEMQQYDGVIAGMRECDVRGVWRDDGVQATGVVLVSVPDHVPEDFWEPLLSKGWYYMPLEGSVHGAPLDCRVIIVPETVEECELDSHDVRLLVRVTTNCIDYGVVQLVDWQKKVITEGEYLRRLADHNRPKWAYYAATAGELEQVVESLL